MVKQYSRCRHILIGSFSIDDGDGSENATLKMNSPFLETLSSLFQFAENVKCRNFPGVNFLETALKFRKRKKIKSSLVYVLH